MRARFWPKNLRNLTCPLGQVVFVYTRAHAIFWIGAVFAFAGVSATAQDLSLLSPIDCSLDGPCHIQQYVDRDPTDGARDFTCGTLSYDGHKGTDFALPTLAMIAQGVKVRASAAGTVRGVRDGMPDSGFSADTADQIADRECGNGVVLTHPGGWETQYCHMRQGSVTVTPGQTVVAGEPLGMVGMSGRAQFAHVHLSVRRNGAVVDPFDRDGVLTCGAPDGKTLWDNPPPVRPGGIISVGTSDAIPDFDAIKAGEVPRATGDADALVIWAYLFGTRAGDLLQLSLTGPEGFDVTRAIRLDRGQAQSFRAIGKKSRSDNWPRGTYEGSAILLRNRSEVERQDITLDLR